MSNGNVTIRAPGQPEVTIPDRALTIRTIDVNAVVGRRWRAENDVSEYRRVGIVAEGEMRETTAAILDQDSVARARVLVWRSSMWGLSGDAILAGVGADYNGTGDAAITAPGLPVVVIPESVLENSDLNPNYILGEAWVDPHMPIPQFPGALTS